MLCRDPTSNDETVRDGAPAECSGLRFDLLLLGLLGGDDHILVFDLEPQPVEDAHVDVRDPNEREPRDEVAAPAGVEKMEPGEDKEEAGDVVRETVLAGEEVEEFSRDQGLAVFGFALAELAWLAEDLLVGDGPGGAGDGQSQQEQVGELG